MLASLTRPNSTVHRMDRLFRRFMNDSFFPELTESSSAQAQLPLNIWETEESFVVEAELPGFDLDDVEVTVLAGELTLEGQRPVPEQEGLSFRHRERGTGRIKRVVRLPLEVDVERVSATLTKGILNVTLPKAQAALPRKISVRALEAPAREEN